MERVPNKSAYSMLSVDFLKAYLITMRPYLMFVSGITGIVGMSFINDLPLYERTFVFIASFLSYGFGQALTDCFQIDTDSISSPYRPLTQGAVSRGLFLLISVIGLIICVTLLSIKNYSSLFLGLAAGIGLFTYTFFKKKWWAGPFYNASIVTMLFFMALNFDGPINLLANADVILTSMIVFFGYSNFVLSGYFKDIEADKITGYNTFPVSFGRKPTTRVSDLFSLLTVIPTIIIFSLNFKFGSLSDFFVISIFMVAGIIISIIAQIKLKRVENDSEAYKPIELVIHSYVLLLSGITLIEKPDWFLPLLGFYSVFVLFIYSRPIGGQI